MTLYLLDFPSLYGENQPGEFAKGGVLDLDFFFFFFFFFPSLSVTFLVFCLPSVQAVATGVFPCPPPFPRYKDASISIA